jgi:ABC-2 type transport system permease protein
VSIFDAVLGDFASQITMSFAIAFISGVLLVIAAFLTCDLENPVIILGFLVAFLVTVICFVAIGIILRALLPTSRAAHGVGVLLFFVMIMVGGAGPPPEVLSGVLNNIANIAPLKHAVVLLQDP